MNTPVPPTATPSTLLLEIDPTSTTLTAGSSVDFDMYVTANGSNVAGATISFNALAHVTYGTVDYIRNPFYKYVCTAAIDAPGTYYVTGTASKPGYTSGDYTVQLTVVSGMTAGVVVNEIAWGGTLASAQDEWIELYNRSGFSQNLTGWTLVADDGSAQTEIALTGEIGPNDYYVIESMSDGVVSDGVADLVTKTRLDLANKGELLTLKNATRESVDRAGKVMSWFAGTDLPHRTTMERIHANKSGDDAANWASNDMVIRNGTDAGGYAINGTPGGENSATVNADADPTPTPIPTPTPQTPANYLELSVVNGDLQPGGTATLRWEIDPDGLWNMVNRPVAIYFGVAEGSATPDRPATVDEALRNSRMYMFKTVKNELAAVPLNPRSIPPTWPRVVFPLAGGVMSGTMDFAVPTDPSFMNTDWVFEAAFIDVQTGGFINGPFPVEISNVGAIR